MAGPFFWGGWRAALFAGPGPTDAGHGGCDRSRVAESLLPRSPFAETQSKARASYRFTAESSGLA